MSSDCRHVWVENYSVPSRRMCIKCGAEQGKKNEQTRSCLDHNPTFNSFMFLSSLMVSRL